MTTTLRLGTSSAAVRRLQQQLTAVGTFKYPKTTGYYGTITKAAVSAFERANGLKVDGIADPAMQALLARRLAKARPTSSSATSGNWKTAAAPAQDYRRLRFRGVTVNARTRQMVLRAEGYAKKLGVRVPFAFGQGSYHRGVSASAGTHDGGGALDVRIIGRSTREVTGMIKALRMAGFAAWGRGSRDGMAPHIHAIGIGDRQASSGARAQVKAYLRGGDGLRGGAADGDRNTAGRPIPNWARRYA